ncbi:ATP-dependent nuclease [Dongia sedimenti]|uniref:ATP-binding protein n=1 Tax=Dongia sedimenti TaxID=3064282 RepID=A0ABU0YSH1_9PROT|nr:ATP-binding protein [Rhodospirillaceae bacterium R-7]
MAEANSSTVRPTVTFESIAFSDGSKIDLDPEDVVVFVGPNNAGKSAALRELEMIITPDLETRVIKQAPLRKDGSVDELRTFLRKHSSIKEEMGENPQYRGYRFSVHDKSLEKIWKRDLRELRALFCHRISTEQRIGGSDPVQAISVLDQSPGQPIHLLYTDDEIERRLSTYFERAFGVELIVFRGGGANWPLLIGERPARTDDHHIYSSAYNATLRAQTLPLQAQGDGMRSFATVILSLLSARTESILLLDEPEAFLHPPQARLLGEFLAKERPKQAQLFIATHSPDVLQGLLSSATDHLRVIRIQRDGNVNRVRELDKQKAREISIDPLMRYSNVLSGVFHQRAIICESDGDCAFYSTLLDSPAIHGARQPDTIFLHANGKHRVAALARTLRGLDVDVDVIVDIDILNDLTVMESLATSLELDWSSIQSDAEEVKKAIESHKPWLTAGEVSKGIVEVLKVVPEAGEFPKATRAKIDAIFRKASPWDAVKSAGEAAIPAGQPTMRWKRLKQQCSEAGFWIVPVGEVEGFCRSIGGHGPRWVQQVLEYKNVLSDPELEAARSFVRAVWERL